VTLNDLGAASIKAFRQAVKTWTLKYTRTSVVIVLESDVHSQTGHIVYDQDEEGRGSHCSVVEVSTFVVKDIKLIDFATDF
jgi:hypothetical protein